MINWSDRWGGWEGRGGKGREGEDMSEDAVIQPITRKTCVRSLSIKNEHFE